jgi:peptidyl-prolyl cis-trans isomerase C
MTFRRHLIASLAVLALAAPALAADPAAAPSKRTPAAPVDTKNLPEIVAKVNGVDIRKVDLQNAIETMSMELQMIGQQMPMDRKDEIWRDVLDKIIGSELLAQDAKTKKVAVTEGEVDGELTKFREKFPSEAVFQSFLKEQGFTEQNIRDEIRKSYGVSKMIKKDIYAKITVDEKAAKEFYDKNPEQFEEPEQIRASHVLVKVEKGADEKTKAEAKKEADQVLADAKAGKDFAVLAKDHSDDPGSKANGGDLDFFVKGQMVPAFEEAVMKLQKPGDLSGVVETVYGFHVIKLTEKKPSRVIPFADVKDDLVDFLVMKKKDENLRAYVETLRKKAKVQIFI